GLQAQADALVVSARRIAAGGCRRLEAGSILLAASPGVSAELDPAEGKGVVVASEQAKVKLRLGPALTVDGTPVQADGDGVAELDLEPGRHTVAFAPFALPETIESLPARLAEATTGTQAAGAGRLPDATVARAWEAGGFEPATEVLPVKSVTSDQEHTGRYGPVEKLTDQVYTGSTSSVMWPAGVTPTITLDLGAETEISSVVLREWHMNEGWDIGERTLEVSSDGFQQDVREVRAPFEDVGTEQWGNNINTLMEAKVGQRARQLRLTVSPAREDSSVYIAEVEVHGIRPGAVPEITAIATGDLDGDGADEVVVASDTGQVRALDAGGRVLWTFDGGKRARINCLACADVNGDGRAEVMCGGDGARLILLGPDGGKQWEVNPPAYRGIPSDVMTVLPADVDGDGVPEVICGCRSWQYFAYDRDGKQLWRNVIYAHSATVGWADDFDGDGRAEIVGGNEYYTLNLIDNDGRRIFNAGRLGPNQTAVSSADVNGDGLPEVLVGTDAGELVCFDGKGNRVWETNVGDRVTRILPADLDGDGADEIVCAGESANVFALHLDGSALWRAPIADGVYDLALVREGNRLMIAAAAGSAGVYLLDSAGEFIARAETGGSAKALALSGGRVVATTDAGLVDAFDLP
ncbi:MAG TPA: FG-GAP-like repeat-containing protein, partial [Armatimonadota bacterium]|nr:FG-GAP-like repeat-containing protein [Armatimonadota bacterium]